jgi:hypothetical protein
MRWLSSPVCYGPAESQWHADQHPCLAGAVSSADDQFHIARRRATGT